MQTWFFAGAIGVGLGVSLIQFLSLVLPSSIFFLWIFGFIEVTLVFSIPSTWLNWVYDRRGYAETQRSWMTSPKGVIGKIGYIFTGAVALWSLLLLGLGLAIAIMAGLLGLGQAAWTT